jgi:LmbE family N-acetylglucosaminyl deacetylase
VVVIAPHPDDEALIAEGVLQRTLHEGRRAAVVLISNGDKGCGRDGFEREAETIAALGKLGLREDDVHFLGYPDGYLAVLGPRPLPPVERRDSEGHCVAGATTYAARGAHHHSEHFDRTGEPALYTAQALVEDLASLLARLQPRDVYVPHPIDSHPDHAATYVFFRRALDRLDAAPRIVHRAVVHAEGCWPAADCGHFFTPDLPIGVLPAPLGGYVLSERLPVDARQKLEILSLYRSQIGADPTANWLAAFARPFEPFAPERLVRSAHGWVRESAQGAAATELYVSLAPAGMATITASGPGRVDDLELTVTNDALELSRLSSAGIERVGRWSLAGKPPGVVRVRVDPRPDDGGITELSFYGPDGFIGEAVLPALFQRAVLRKVPGSSAPQAGSTTPPAPAEGWSTPSGG